MGNADYSIFWREAVSQIQTELSEQEFSLWFKNIVYNSAEENKIYISVPSNFYKDQIKKRYQSYIEKKIADISGHNVSLEFNITNAAVADQIFTNDNDDKPLSDSKNKSIDNYASQSVKQRKFPRPNLRSDFIFKRFIQSDDTKFAYSAAHAIAKNPGHAYNPFLIYGGVGLGKTHLMQSIGNQIYEEYDLNIIYIPTEDFVTEFLTALSTNKTQHFKNKFRRVDVLLIDDIHFFSGKKAVQEELFYTFDALYNANKQIVFTCDRPIYELKDISERLASRFKRGLNVDLRPPNYETRYAILQNKIDEIKNLSISPEIIDLIAKNITSNVRDLEAALTTLRAYSELTGEDITLETARQKLKDMLSAPKYNNISMNIIILSIAEHYNISSSDICGKKRNKNIVLPRQIAMYITREITEYSITEIGNEFGGRDHSTVIHACQKIEDLLKFDSTLNSTINMLIDSIKNYTLKK